MSKSVILAEKPSVARDIARVLKCNKKINGGLEGDKYIVTWALGHLVTLADPEKYDNRFKDWRLEDLPITPEKFKLVVMPKTSKQYNAVKSLLLRKDVNTVIIATDAGREGELVARWIIEKANVRKSIKRLWISSVTDKAIKDGFNKLKDGRAYNSLYDSAVARAEADWVVGINATRALTTKHNAQLSCGRVQTPTLAMVHSRAEAIKKFVPKPYYGITAKSEMLTLAWQDSKTRSKQTFNKDFRDDILSKVKNQTGTVKAIKSTYKKTKAPTLYDLTDLQRECNTKYGFSPKKTLNTMQALYERHKVVTYPRTDSRYLTSDMADTIKDRLSACAVGDYRSIAMSLLQDESYKRNKSYINNSKVSDHHAIIPTEIKPTYGMFTADEKRVYDLVAKRFIAALMENYVYELIELDVDIAGETFTVNTNVTDTLGWKAVYEKANSENKLADYILKVKNRSTMKFSSIEATEGKTTPPSPFTEATLLAAMENPVAFLNDDSKENKKSISTSGGIGTVATRADIIDKLFNSFLIEKRGTHLYPTSKGRQLLELVPPELKSPDLTAKWEMRLGDIIDKKETKSKFVNDMKQYANTVVSQIKGGTVTFKHDNITGKKCPDCGGFLLEVNGKHGKMNVCQDRNCGYRKSVSKITNSRCPNCHKKLTLVGDGDKQMFVCKCGHREKLSAFKKRKNESSGANKREVQKMLNKQEIAPANNPFADLLKDFKVDK